MRYRSQIIPLARNQRPGYILWGGRARSLTVHNTANPDATADNHADWLTRDDTRASAHIFVDDIEAVRVIPLNEHAWHSGTTEGNATSIGIEVCEFSDRARQDAADDNAQRLIADMLTGAAPPEFRTAHLDLSDVRTHQSWKQYGATGKYCPRMIIPWWDRFIAEIGMLMDKEDAMYWVIIALFGTPADAGSFADWCAAAGIAAKTSGAAVIAHGNDEKSRKAEAEAERRGGICPWGRVYTTQESYKHFSRRTPYIPAGGGNGEALAVCEDKLEAVARHVREITSIIG